MLLLHWEKTWPVSEMEPDFEVDLKAEIWFS